MRFNRIQYAFALAPIVALAAACNDDVSNPSTTPGGNSGTLPSLDGGATTDGGATGAIQGAGGDIRVPGLTAGVTAVYDQNGFLHISAKTDNDAFATLGYFHAANRFFFMDFVRSAVRGVLGTKFTGTSVLSQDVTARTFFADPKTGDPLPDVLYAQLDDASKAVFQAYAAGVNAWLADVKNQKNGATLTDEYRFLNKDIAPWDPSDCFAVALYSLNDLSNDAENEIALGQMGRALQQLQNGGKLRELSVLRDAFFGGKSTYDDVSALGSANGPTAALSPTEKAKARKASGKPAKARAMAQDALAEARSFLKRLPGAHSRSNVGDTGSNNWVIRGDHTSNGNSLVANDPHLLLTNPSIWFPVEIDGKTNGTGTYHVAGGSFPGIPTIQTGHNETLAWGVTVSYWDLADAYVETVNQDDPTSVNFNPAASGKVPFVVKQVQFVDNGKPVTQTLKWVPHHGPVVAKLNDAGTQVLTIRWRGLDGSTDVQGVLGIGRATNLAEARGALANITTANQNFVVADSNGEIGYYPFSKVPLRPWANVANPWTPIPGNGNFEWGDPVAVANIPQATNPPSGFVATANGDITGTYAQAPFTSDPSTKPIQSFAHAEGTREKRIVDLLRAAGTANSLDTIRAVQGDTTSLPATAIVPKLLEAAAAANIDGATPAFNAQDAGTAAVIGALTAWNTAGKFTCPTGIDGLKADGAKNADAVESIGCTAFHVAFYHLLDAAFGDELIDATAVYPALAAGKAMSYVNSLLPTLQRAIGNDGALFWQDTRISDIHHVTTRTEILQRALTNAGALLSSKLGTNTDDWRWGRIHTANIKSLLPSALGFDAGKFPAPGGLYTVNVSNPSNVSFDPTVALIDQFSANAGPSVRTLIEVPKTGFPTMRMMLPGGADLHRDGRFYNNLVSNWQTDTPVDFPFGAGAVTNPAATITVSAP